MTEIRVGVCGWGDHDLYPPKTPSKEKLALYASHFDVVEVDSSYHAIQPPERWERWVEDTPPGFRFVVKAYREMTGHGRPQRASERTREEVFDLFEAFIRPVTGSGKLSMVLFQFSPWFDCTREHVRYIRWCRERYPTLPLAVEFRHRSWFLPRFQEKTLQFLKDHELIHVVCDEPQAGEGSVPIVPEVTHSELSLIRFHGRNREGWSASHRPDWREIRYAYRYSEEELREWLSHLHRLRERTKQLILLFNNNSQGDAADNAKQMIRLLAEKGWIEPSADSPPVFRQGTLF
jgi:uncharacterized protein YecE (DUF72 family)